jgi:hypothetical protein
MRTTLSLCCSLLLLTVVDAKNQVPNTPKEVQVHFRFQERVLTLHEPVVALFEVHNGMTKPVVVTVGATVRQFFDLSLKIPSGEVLHKDPYEGQVDIVSYGGGTVTVEPGANYSEPLVLNRWFPFQSEGTYTLTSRLTSDIITADGDFRPGSETQHLLVNPREPARLNKICAELEKQAESATTVDAAQFPALALSYVNDPIATPYLARLLSAHALSYAPAVVGLERIGTDEAAEVLLAALNEHWGDIGDLALVSLTRMQDRIHDPNLKETVKKTVERTSERARAEFIKGQIAYLDYRSPQLQTAAIQNLTRVPGGLKEAEPVLRRLAGDTNQPADVRHAAEIALSELHRE